MSQHNIIKLNQVRKGKGKTTKPGWILQYLISVQSVGANAPDTNPAFWDKHVRCVPT